jgi:ribonuclease HII
MTFPNFSFEKKQWKKGFKYVVGVDEVGRGAFAGPIVVGAVIWPRPLRLKTEDLKLKIDGVNDSKLLKPRFREQLTKEIKEKALAWDVTEVGVSVINRIGIAKATEKAMRKTIKDLKRKGFPPDFVLIDYYYVPYLHGVGKKRQQGIKHGDQKSFSIAAASILAKVHRDKLMRSLARKPRYKLYGWGKNKGYGTSLHRKAILRYGLTRYHRKRFVEGWREKTKRGRIKRR